MSDEQVQGQTLVEAARILAHHSITEAYGHVSVRLSDEQYLLTPRVGPGLSTTDTLLKMDIATGDVAGDTRVPIEASIHTCIYRARPDVQAIARIHSFPATTVSVCGEPLRPVHYLGSILGAVVPIHDVADLVLGPDSGVEVADALGGHAALMLRGNGQVVVGRSLEEATARALYLDESAKLSISARTYGTATPLTEAEVAGSAEIWADEINVRRIWDYHRRWALDRPS
jgi:HCOMODA/2-hydroxy-3-carboxy-muconic semialdehyde decarboxylase